MIPNAYVFYSLPSPFFRYDSQSGGEREIQRTMLELLNQLDGFDSQADVKVITLLRRLDGQPKVLMPYRFIIISFYR